MNHDHKRGLAQMEPELPGGRMNHNWLFVRPTFSQRFLMRVYRIQDWIADNWSWLGQGALSLLFVLIGLVLLFAIYAAGVVRGEQMAEGCQLDHGQESIAVLGFRDDTGHLHCRYQSNPYYAPRIKG